MTEHRDRTAQDRTATECRIRALLRTLGIAAPRGPRTKAGIGWLRGLELAEELDVFMRDELVERLARQGVRRSAGIRAYCERIRGEDPHRKPEVTPRQMAGRR